MPTFRTELSLPKYERDINHRTPVLSLGSCFAEHLGRRLAEVKVPVNENPFGILYHPEVIARNLELLLEGAQIKAAEQFRHQDLWRHFAFHGRYSLPGREEHLALINGQVQGGYPSLRQSKFLLLTLGTAWGYRLRETGALVANCHKLPADRFQRFRSTKDEIVARLGEALLACRAVNPQLRVVLTVSPVRHLRDGLVENQRGKAILLLAAEELTTRYDFIDYFPAYELVLDDLRDYRFYEADLAHPNQLAVDYVWEKFTQAFWSEATHRLAREVGRLVKAARHHPLHPATESHQAFVAHTLRQMTTLEETHAFLDFSAEKAALTSQLAR